MNKKRFVLTRKNQKGQVAIFVALIFQVIFVFFAILINIGLLVHHKINLQQSTDLAAYYGAMKQAEIMNMISHVNFQMRQAWKLLTWRYRVVGTFAFQDWFNGRAPGERIKFPLEISQSDSGPPTFFEPESQNYTCPNGVSPLDVPFFCAGHRGFSNWQGDKENNCRLNCKHISDSLTSIQGIEIQTNPYDTTGEGSTGGLIGSTNRAMMEVNKNLNKLCNNLGPKGLIMMSKFLMAYESESRQKKLLIQMLGANLSLPADKALDLEGGLIKEGAQKTFLNNLTEANKTGQSVFEVVNGLSQGSCGFAGAPNDGKPDNNQFLAEILIPVVQFYVHSCTGEENNRPEFKFAPKSLYNDSNFNSVNTQLKGTIDDSTFAQINARIKAIQYIVGYEKNPWCVVYYGAKAQSEPKIPFLPISKIKLSAFSFAKPFGGSIGPRYKQKWSSGSQSSDLGSMTDPNLPVKSGSDLSALSSIKQAISTFPNYANYVGDFLGLKDAQLLATYQEILLHRELTEQENSPLHISRNKEADVVASPVGITASRVWPGDSNWNRLLDPDSNSYDYLATDGDKNSFLRDLEISVIAPNQFDLTYYSIDPDYYNNYYLKLIGGTAGPLTFKPSLDKIRSQVGGRGPQLKEFHMDYGFNSTLSNDIAANYSVRHQMAVAAKIIKPITRKSEQNFNKKVSEVLGFIPDKPSSLLTGWTFKNFSEFNAFPSAGPDSQNTMTFGKCLDEKWNKTSSNEIVATYDSPVSINLPPTPGNCVWGGRTGYSVKIVSPSMIRINSPAQPLGGEGTNGQLLNALDDKFLTF